MQKVELKKYDQYKDSGVEWLGEIPENWNTKPIRAIFQERRKKNAGPVTDFILSVTKDRGVIPYDEKGAIGNNKSEDIERYKVVYPNDLVINKMNVVIGSLGLSKYHGALSQVYIILQPKRDEFNINYFTYIFSNSTFYKSLIKYCTGIMELRESLNLNDFKKLPLPIPSIKEQTAIASFLDEKCGKLDQAIAQKQKLIELLKERKQILIQNAVTKGLDPKVKMKDSGVDWIGEIPEHWAVSKLSYYAKKMQTGPFGSQLHSHEYISNGIPVINPSHIINGEITPDYSQTIDRAKFEELKQHSLKFGDIVFGRRGEMGRCALVHENQEEMISGTGSIKITLDVTKMSPEYFNIYLKIPSVKSWFSLNSVGSTMENLNTEILSILPIIVLKLEEQKKIIAYIETQSTKIDSAIDVQEEQIEKLKEYKASLINSAVTGKIKVC